MFGLLNLNKPLGMTSRDVVDLVQASVKPAKVGHAGTLDPLAEGVLLVCIGPATRLIEYLHRMPKRYRGVFLLGRRSNTEDITGTVVDLESPRRPEREEVEAAVQRFVGQIEQTPPVYSAKKVRGQRAYKLARSGKRPKLAARTITIHQVKVLSYAYPELQLDVTCSSGTYLRSLGRDIGHALGSAAVMSALTRTEIGEFRLQDAVATDGLTRRDVRERLISPLAAVASLPQVLVTSEEERHIGQGRSIERQGLPAAQEYAAVTDTGRLAAILTPREDDLVGPARYFPPTEAHLTAKD